MRWFSRYCVREVGLSMYRDTFNSSDMYMVMCQVL